MKATFLTKNSNFATLASNSFQNSRGAFVSPSHMRLTFWHLDDTCGGRGHRFEAGRAGSLVLAETEHFSPGSEAAPHGSSMLGLSHIWLIFLSAVMLIKQTFVNCLERLQMCGGFSLTYHRQFARPESLP